MLLTTWRQTILNSKSILAGTGSIWEILVGLKVQEFLRENKEKTRGNVKFLSTLYFNLEVRKFAEFIQRLYFLQWIYNDFNHHYFNLEVRNCYLLYIKYNLVGSSHMLQQQKKEVCNFL